MMGHPLHEYVSDCTLAVGDASLFDYEKYQEFTLKVKVRDMTFRAPGQSESDIVPILVSVVDVNEPPFFKSNLHMVDTAIRLISSTYTVEVNKGKFKDFMNGETVVLQIETTQMHDVSPFLYGSISFQSIITDSSSVGLNIIATSPSTTQIKIANGTTMAIKTFSHQHMYKNVKNRRTIIIERVRGGRAIQVFANGIESTSGSQFVPAAGNIYDEGDILFGDGFGMKFDGILHRLSVSKNRMFLENCTSSCSLSTSKALVVDEGTAGVSLADLQMLATDNDSYDYIGNLDFSVSRIYPNSGNSNFAITSLTPNLVVIDDCNFELVKQYIISIVALTLVA